MSVHLFDTLSRQIKALPQPDKNQKFGFYCCGPTVYGPAHIGNFRTFLLQDVLRRVLELKLGAAHLCHVRNITDVDDKTIRQSRAEGKTLSTFTAHWTEQFHADCAALNLRQPHHEPRATEHIAEQIDMIRTLIEREHAYVAADGSVYFRVASFADYGKLANLDPQSLQTQHSNSAGERNDADEYERETVADFALWKSFKPEDGDNFWDSPWGRGRPGWHIECSAMAIRYLGPTFDLHGGGIDLCFPHHENEIAQSECSHGHPFVRHWFHTSHLMVDGGKMSKSLGNLYTLADLTAKGYTAMEVRFALISGHYRQSLNFTLKSLDDARSALHKLGRQLSALLQAAGIPAADFQPQGDNVVDSPALAALCQDLNTPACIGRLFTELKDIPTNATEAADKAAAVANVLFGLGIDAQALLAPEQAAEIPAEVASLAQQRWQAKADRDWAAADKLRDQILAAGWVIRDHKDGYDLELSSSTDNS